MVLIGAMSLLNLQGKSPEPTALPAKRNGGRLRSAFSNALWPPRDSFRFTAE